MDNPNMSRYLAWASLSRLVKTSIRRRFFPRSFAFTYIPPKTSVRHQLLPYEQWKANKKRDSSYYDIVFLVLLFMTYQSGKFVFEVLQDEDKGYAHHIRYPILCKMVELIAKDVESATGPVMDIVPKDRFGVGQIFPRLYDLVFQKQSRIEEKDRRVAEYKKELEEYDRTHK